MGKVEKHRALQWSHWGNGDISEEDSVGGRGRTPDPWEGHPILAPINCCSSQLLLRLYHLGWDERLRNGNPGYVRFSKFSK